MIDVVNLYSNEYDLYINMSKTKIVIFRNRGNCKPEEKWFLNGNHSCILSLNKTMPSAYIRRYKENYISQYQTLQA
jgi:hypothetical protein